MTEKRFVGYFDKDHNYIIQDLIKETEYQVGFVNCDEDLFLEMINEIADENEQLKSTINTLTHDNTKMKKVLNTTKNENEQIKHLIKEAYHNERTKLGQSVLKQLINNIEAI